MEGYELNIFTCSMMNTLIDPNDNDMWLEAINGKYFGGRPFEKHDWDMLLGHCQVSQVPSFQSAHTPMGTSSYAKDKRAS